MKKSTDIHSLSMQIKTDVERFKNTYESVFEKLSAELKMPTEVKPGKVILDQAVGHCSMFVLRHPKTPAYKMNDYIFRLAQVLKSEYDLNTVLLKRDVTYVDEDDVPEILEVNPKEVEEIIKRAQEDELFSDKYKERTRVKVQIGDADDLLDAKACAYAEKLSKALEKAQAKEAKKVEDGPSAESSAQAEKTTDQEVMITEIKFSIEKNGQLCLVF